MSVLTCAFRIMDLPSDDEGVDPCLPSPVKDTAIPEKKGNPKRKARAKAKAKVGEDRPATRVIKKSKVTCSMASKWGAQTDMNAVAARHKCQPSTQCQQ